MIRVRNMQHEDILAVFEIEKESFSVPWSVQSFEESLKQSYAIFLVAELEGCIVGYIGMYQMGLEGDITNVAVLPQFRGTGIGTLLLESIIQKAKDVNIQDITLEVRESNRSAIGLYSKVGFVSVGIRKDFYEKPKENAVVMWKYGISD